MNKAVISKQLKAVTNWWHKLRPWQVCSVTFDILYLTHNRRRPKRKQQLQRYFSIRFSKKQNCWATVEAATEFILRNFFNWQSTSHIIRIYYSVSDQNYSPVYVGVHMSVISKISINCHFPYILFSNPFLTPIAFPLSQTKLKLSKETCLKFMGATYT